MSPLPKPSIDTGLGLERLAAVMQGGKSNWESDLFLPIIKRVEELSGRECSGDDRDSIAIRVIADHSRAAAFLVADGVIPSNEGSGYVLRRILRRALRYGKYIGLNEPFLYDTAHVVVDYMHKAYPELQEQSTLIAKVIRNEEERFIDTLARGLTLFHEEVESIRKNNRKKLPGEVAFKLYDTYGFPADLTRILAAEEGLSFDQAEFDKEMNRQREKAREARDDAHGEEIQAIKELVNEGLRSEFTGYMTLDDTATIKAIIKDAARCDTAGSGEKVEIITDRTPFYGESGGQVGDHGIISLNGNTIEVEETIKVFGNIIIHKGRVTTGAFQVGDKVKLKVDTGLRHSIMANHSATHLLQWALRAVLGDHVNQSGSLVEPRRLRFDFTHFSPISSEEIARIEDLVNGKVRENVMVAADIMPIEEAKTAGAIALFGEKYGDTVRMVSVGDFSKELCGGTHVEQTGDIGFFKIVSEGGIAAGVRRIEAVTGEGAVEYVRKIQEEVNQIAQRLKASPGELVPKLDRLIEERKIQDREIEALKAKLASKVTGDILDGLTEIKGVQVLAKLLDDVSSPKDLRAYADKLRDRMKSGIALLGAKSDGKAMLLAFVTKDLTGKYHAGNIVKKAAAVIGGSGGGRPDMAQAGGPDVDRLKEAVESVESFLS